MTGERKPSPPIKYLITLLELEHRKSRCPDRFCVETFNEAIRLLTNCVSKDIDFCVERFLQQYDNANFKKFFEKHHIKYKDYHDLNEALYAVYVTDQKIFQEVNEIIDNLLEYATYRLKLNRRF